MILNLNEVSDKVRIAEYRDVCYLCAKDYAIKNKVHPLEAKEALYGKLLTKRVFYFDRRGERFIFCEQCLKNVLNEISPSIDKDKEESTVKTKKETVKNKEKKMNDRK